MRRALAVVLVLAFGYFAHAQIALTGAGAPISSAVTYQGPGDVVSGATLWGSCARVYNAAAASTSTPLCDLVDSAAPTTVICTLRGSSTGFVDLTGTYCTGGVTPSVKCAAATGGKCNVEKVYDQTGHGNHLTNTTAASQPVLTFSALNSLPGMSCTSAAGSILATAATFTQAQPFSMSTVAEITSITGGEGVIIGSGGVVIYLGVPASSINQWELNAGAVQTTAATGNAFHAGNALFNTTSSILSIDGVDSVALSPGTNGYSANTIRFCRGNAAASVTGVLMEAGVWLTTSFNATQRGLLSTNQHSAANGYNF